VPGYLAVWDLLDVAVPELLMRLGRRLIGDNRALTVVDHDARRDYERAIQRRSSEMVTR
jgi:hypothetical protein